MTVTGEELRLLHRIHRQLTDVRERLARGPKQLRAADANTLRMEGELKQIQNTTKSAKILSDQKQLQLKTIEDRITDIKTKLNACSSNREYQAFKEQIAADEMANSVLADEILETMEKIDQHEIEVTQAKNNLEACKQEREKISQRIEQEKQSLEMDLARLQGELIKSEASFSDDFKSEYDRIARAKGEQALAEVDGQCCGGCYQMITPQMINELHLSKPVFCKSCGRLLYLPENLSLGSTSD